MNEKRETSDEKRISFWHPASLICTVFGVGKLRPASGTWGSLAGLIFFVIFPEYALFALVPLFFIGAAAANHYGQKSGKDDASEIVVDEVVGMWVSLLLFIHIAQTHLNISGDISTATKVFAYLICFITFRFFDAIKKGPVGWCDRNIKGGFGVMFDDVVAGIMAGCTSALIFLALA